MCDGEEVLRTKGITYTVDEDECEDVQRAGRQPRKDTVLKQTFHRAEFEPIVAEEDRLY